MRKPKNMSIKISNKYLRAYLLINLELSNTILIITLLLCLYQEASLTFQSFLNKPHSTVDFVWLFSPKGYYDRLSLILFIAHKEISIIQYFSFTPSIFLLFSSPPFPYTLLFLSLLFSTLLHPHPNLSSTLPLSPFESHI